MNTEKYKMLRNFIHNELGITREDIEQWIKEAIAARLDSQSKRILSNDEYTRTVIRERIDLMLNNCVGPAYSRSQEIKKLIGEQIAENLVKPLKITVSLPTGE